MTLDTYRLREAALSVLRDGIGPESALAIETHPTEVENWFTIFDLLVDEQSVEPEDVLGAVDLFSTT